MHSMMVSKRYPRLKVARLIGTCLHSLDEGDSPSKDSPSKLSHCDCMSVTVTVTLSETESLTLCLGRCALCVPLALLSR